MACLWYTAYYRLQQLLITNNPQITHPSGIHDKTQDEIQHVFMARYPEPWNLACRIRVRMQSSIHFVGVQVLYVPSSFTGLIIAIVIWISEVIFDRLSWSSASGPRLGSWLIIILSIYFEVTLLTAPIENLFLPKDTQNVCCSNNKFLWLLFSIYKKCIYLPGGGGGG